MYMYIDVYVYRENQRLSTQNIQKTKATLAPPEGKQLMIQVWHCQSERFVFHVKLYITML